MKEIEKYKANKVATYKLILNKDRKALSLIKPGGFVYTKNKFLEDSSLSGLAKQAIKNNVDVSGLYDFDFEYYKFKKGKGEKPKVENTEATLIEDIDSDFQYLEENLLEQPDSDKYIFLKHYIQQFDSHSNNNDTKKKQNPKEDNTLSSQGRVQ